MATQNNEDFVEDLAAGIVTLLIAAFAIMVLVVLAHIALFALAVIPGLVVLGWVALQIGRFLRKKGLYDHLDV